MNIILILPQIFLIRLGDCCPGSGFCQKGRQPTRVWLISRCLGWLSLAIMTVFIPDGQSFGGAYLSDNYGRLFNLIFLAASFLTILASVDFAEIRFPTKPNTTALSSWPRSA